MTNCCFYLTSSLLGLKSQGQIDLDIILDRQIFDEIDERRDR